MRLLRGRRGVLSEFFFFFAFVFSSFFLRLLAGLVYVD
jgi:hypothetical protein